MTASVRQLLESFNALSEAEKYEATVELLRHLQQDTRGGLSDEALVEVADELFRDLEAREEADARAEAR